mgnify:CR=1 FL=1
MRLLLGLLKNNRDVTELDLAATYAKKMLKNQAKYPAGPQRHHSPGGEG